MYFFPPCITLPWFVLLNKKLSIASCWKTVICLNRLRFYRSLSEIVGGDSNFGKLYYGKICLNFNLNMPKHFLPLIKAIFCYPEVKL